MHGRSESFLTLSQRIFSVTPHAALPADRCGDVVEVAMQFDDLVVTATGRFTAAVASGSSGAPEANRPIASCRRSMRRVTSACRLIPRPRTARKTAMAPTPNWRSNRWRLTAFDRLRSWTSRISAPRVAPNSPGPTGTVAGRTKVSKLRSRLNRLSVRPLLRTLRIVSSTRGFSSAERPSAVRVELTPNPVATTAEHDLVVGSDEDRRANLLEDGKLTKLALRSLELTALGGPFRSTLDLCGAHHLGALKVALKRRLLDFVGDDKQHQPHNGRVQGEEQREPESKRVQHRAGRMCERHRLPSTCGNTAREWPPEERVERRRRGQQPSTKQLPLEPRDRRHELRPRHSKPLAAFRQADHADPLHHPLESGVGRSKPVRYPASRHRRRGNFGDSTAPGRAERIGLLFVRLEIIPPNDEHSQDFERRRDAVENLDTARLEDLRANRLVRDDRVHLASAKRGEVTRWRQVDEPHVARRKTSLLERAIEQVRVNRIESGLQRGDP